MAEIIVAEINGEVEAFASTSLGDIQYLDTKLNFSEVGYGSHKSDCS